MVRIDLKDAYFTSTCISAGGGQTYEFTCFPFGLATAPPVFTKVIEASCGVHQEQVSAVCGIHRLVSAHALEETGSDRADSSNSRSELV